MKHIAIIGNGISGVTAARKIRQKDSDCRITIISAETDYFFSRTALMYVYMGHMKFENTQPYEPKFWKKNRLNLKRGFVNTIDFDHKTLHFAEGDKMEYDSLILAVGSKPKKFGWKGQDLPGAQGLYSAQDLELLEKNTKEIDRAVVVGGGLIGIELVEMLLSRDIKVTLLVRENHFWRSVLPNQESELVARHILEHQVDLRLNSELEEIIEGNDGRASKVKLKNGEEIICQLVGLTIGVEPNIAFLKGSKLGVDKGILVDINLETNIPGVYAIGDCAQFKNPPEERRPFEQVWYTGRIMGEVVAETVCGNKTPYAPGHWFNSAKFFDIEYQTYGRIYSKLREGEKEFYWEHKEGKLCMHFVFDAASRKFKGINSFGIRLRHHAFDAWLTEERSVEFVLEHLKDANFDPEFYAQYEEEIIAQFNTEQNTGIQIKKKSWKRILSFSN